MAPANAALLDGWVRRIHLRPAFLQWCRRRATILAKPGHSADTLSLRLYRPHVVIAHRHLAVGAKIPTTME